MVAALQHTLKRLPWAAWLAALPVLLVGGTVVPGLVVFFASVLDVSVWQALWSDAQWPQALRLTLITSLFSTLLACIMAGLLVMLHYPVKSWLKLQRHLPLLLALPHAAFAIGVFFLLAPSGWLARVFAPMMGWSSPPLWETVQDPWGLGLTLALAIKESWFLLWMLSALLVKNSVSRQIVLGQSLGYRRSQVWMHFIWPPLLKQMQWPLLAVFAYSLSVVDMALILGPGNPPTLAVLAWRWLSDPDPELQVRGNAVCVALLGILLWAIALVKVIVWVLHKLRPYPTGKRIAISRSIDSICKPPMFTVVFASAYAALMVLLLWSVAQSWFFPVFLPESFTWRYWQQTDWSPFFTTLSIALVCCILALPIALVWLEWGASRMQGWMYLPLILPALPLVAAQYASLIYLQLDGSFVAVVWSHLLWVLPYMVLTLVGPYQAFDPRLLLCARAMGCSHWSACLRVKWPLLLRPIVSSMAVGFAVSVAQYLPTLFAGAGRFVTVTTEAVTLSAGGNRSIMAVQALLQIVLPLLALGLASFTAYVWGRHRQGVQ